MPARRRHQRARRSRSPDPIAEAMRIDILKGLPLDALMKTLITTLAIMVLSVTTLPAKDGTFSSVIIRETDKTFQLKLAARQWIKITNFIENLGNPEMPAGVAVFQGEGALWVLFASNPTDTHAAHEDVFIGGPATITVTLPTKGSTAFLTYLRGSD